MPVLFSPEAARNLLELLDPVIIERDRLPVDDGSVLRGRIIDIDRDFQNFTCSLVISDQFVFGTQSFITQENDSWSTMDADERQSSGYWVSDSGFAVTGNGDAYGVSRYW